MRAGLPIAPGSQVRILPLVIFSPFFPLLHHRDTMRCMDESPRRSISMPKPYWDALEARAKAEDRSVASLVRLAVADMLGGGQLRVSGFTESARDMIAQKVETVRTVESPNDDLRVRTPARPVVHSVSLLPEFNPAPKPERKKR